MGINSLIKLSYTNNVILLYLYIDLKCKVKFRRLKQSPKNNQTTKLVQVELIYLSKHNIIMFIKVFCIFELIYKCKCLKIRDRFCRLLMSDEYQL